MKLTMKWSIRHYYISQKLMTGKESYVKHFFPYGTTAHI
jgi:hypothetical protein